MLISLSFAVSLPKALAPLLLLVFCGPSLLVTSCTSVVVGDSVLLLAHSWCLLHTDFLVTGAAAACPLSSSTLIDFISDYEQ